MAWRASASRIGPGVAAMRREPAALRATSAANEPPATAAAPSTVAASACAREGAAEMRGDGAGQQALAGDGAGVGAAGGVGREHQRELARGVAQQQGVLLGRAAPGRACAGR